MPCSKKRFVILFFLCLCLSVAGILPVRAAPGMSGECGCLYLPQIDRMLVEKNADRRHPMASTTKIMTALVAIENCRLDDEVVIPEEAVGVEGSSIYLRAGEHQTMENLLYALLLSSANDAAAAIAIHTAGSIAAFADMMNERAADMGLKNTHFTNPHGLNDENHYTTASDLARIAAEAMANPTFRTIVSTKHKVIRVQDGTQARALSNHNRLLRSYEDCVGVKTGYTKISGRCLVSAAERDGMLLIAVTLDAPDDWRDHTHMLDYGFSLYEGRILDDCDGLTLDVPVVGGESDVVHIRTRSSPSVIVPKGSEDLELSFEIHHFATAPVGRGDTLGIVRYTLNGETVAVLPLLAEESVRAKPIHENLLDKIKNLFGL